jgi:hypothetical protein
VRRGVLALAALVAFLGVFYAAFARLALHAFPFSGDEYSYFLQAELFARGLLHAPTPAHAELLRVDHVLLEPWVCSKYPPGTSALLAIGVRYGVPWLVTPVEGVITLVAMAFAARRLLPERAALMAVAMLGAAPLIAFQAASFFSHTAATMWLSIAFAAIVAWTCEAGGRGTWRLVLAGLAIGCAFITRPFDAAVFGVALVSLRSFKVVAVVAAGTVPLVVLHFAYQAAQFGSPWTDGYHAYEPTFRAIYGAHTAAPPMAISNLLNGEQTWHRFDIVRSFLIDWTVPGMAVIALVGWYALGDDPRALPARRFGTTIVALFAFSFLFTIAGTDDGARPRYMTTTLLPLALFAGPGWYAASELLAARVGPWPRRVLGVVVWVLTPVQLGAFLFVRTPEIWVREGLQQVVEQQGVHDAVVIVRAQYPTRYARNVSAPSSMGVDPVRAAFPGRSVYEAHEGLPWSLVRAP